MSKKRKKRRYEVGYGRPPRHSRFQPGQSGNPRGRPRKEKLLITRELLERVVRCLEEFLGSKSKRKK